MKLTEDQLDEAQNSLDCMDRVFDVIDNALILIAEQLNIAGSLNFELKILPEVIEEDDE